MNAIRYVCEGECGGKVTENDFHQGKKTCAAKSCKSYQKPLVRKEYCPQCNTVFEEGEEHFCA